MEVEGMIIWIIKMLLKFMKPIAKLAIMSGLLEELLSTGDDDADDTEDITSAEG